MKRENITFSEIRQAFRRSGALELDFLKKYTLAVECQLKTETIKCSVSFKWVKYLDIFLKRIKEGKTEENALKSIKLSDVDGLYSVGVYVLKNQKEINATNRKSIFIHKCFEEKYPEWEERAFYFALPLLREKILKYYNRYGRIVKKRLEELNAQAQKQD